MAQTGRVKWFSGSKGFGFIECEDGQDLFVHFTAIKTDGFKSLEEGDKVQFEIIVGDKGRPQASDVVKIP